MVLALLQSVTGGSSTTDKPIDDVFVEPITVICRKSDASSADTPAKLPTSDSVVIIPDHKTYEEHHDTGSGVDMGNTTGGTPDLPIGQKEDLINGREKNICAQANIETAIISEMKGNKSASVSGQVDQSPVSNLLHQADEPKSSMEQNPSPRKHSNGGIDTGVINKGVEMTMVDGLYTTLENRNKNKGSGALATYLTSSSFSPPQKVESAAENDLQPVNCEATFAATSTVFVSKSNENENKSQVNEMMLPCNKSLPVMHYNSRIHMTRNEGKKKTISVGDSNVSLSNEENDYHFSVQSCQNAGFFLPGKKRCSFQKQGKIGSKKVKKQIQETSYCESYVKPDSSFMNLISNMMKGCSQSTQDEDKSFTLTLENPDQTLLTCNKTQVPELKDAGFRSNFQAISYPRFKNVGTRLSHHVGEASKYFEPGNKIHGVEATPTPIYADNNSLYRQHLQSRKFEASKGRHDACLSLQPQIRPMNSLNSHEHWKKNLVKKENYNILEHSKEKEGMALSSLHSPSTEPNKNDKDNNNVESCAPCERKEICHKSDTLRGLWITRFSQKSTFPLIIFDQLNVRGNSEVQKHISLNNCKVEETRDQSAEDQFLSEDNRLHNCISKEAPIGLKDDMGNNSHKPRHWSNHITPLPGLKDSEPMVSMFARRLGAIKQCQLTE
ncbi:hypothetical protein RJT34_23488 [Clitoria ternatea]|uniref:Uncharacterized protein n=1 Tax=Clitoria ternatea TaxID=43366 RepID=A0AAN9FL78_CLITE